MKPSSTLAAAYLRCAGELADLAHPITSQNDEQPHRQFLDGLYQSVYVNGHEKGLWAEVWAAVDRVTSAPAIAAHPDAVMRFRDMVEELEETNNRARIPCRVKRPGQPF